MQDREQAVRRSRGSATDRPALEGFEWLRRLGAGGSGEVWLARECATHDLVAVKSLDLDRVALAAFERTTAQVAALGDPHILNVERIIAAGGSVWLVMEYAPGGDLGSLRGKPWPEVVRAALPIAHALVRLHRAGIVHRDVKATNVLLMADGTPRLADFGAALAIGETPGRSSAPGSLYSMSPQCLDGAPASVADDIYAYGAMLYELLSGYPPFYPRVTPERIRREMPGPIRASIRIPEPLERLVAWCLRKAPEARPGSMEVVGTHLQRVLEDVPALSAKSARLEHSMSTNESSNEMPERREAPVVRPPSTPAAPLRVEWHRTPPRSPDSAARRHGFRRILSVSALVLSALALFVVFFVLPKWVEPQLPARAEQVAPTVEPQTAATPVPSAPVDFAALAKAKQQADEVREPLFERLERLRERGAEQWAAEDYQHASAELEAADVEYAGREYLAAVAHLEKLEPLLAALEARASAVLKEQLAAGAEALRTGRSSDAKAAFELALRIEPKNATAVRGLERAGTLDQVLALLASAKRAEDEGNFAAALADYRRALELDMDMTSAREGVARMSARLSQDAFASAMARGFAALGAENFRGAREAFEAAGKIRPDAPEVAAALKQVEQSERTQSIAAKLASARELEAREQWARALSTYREILDLDSTVAAAKEGVARVEPRAQLNEELELYLTQPERLFSAPVRASARQTIERAAAIPHPGPVLTQQIAKLRDWLARAEVPVQVVFQSDNLTHVTIFRVGTLGTFEHRSLELAPGEYTVIGTRPGYRDVRRQIMVVPGAPMPPIVIRCEEKI